MDFFRSLAKILILFYGVNLWGSIPECDSLWFTDKGKRHFYEMTQPADGKEINGAIIFLDPAGQAAFPLSLYGEIIDELGCMAVCSWEIRNGPLEENLYRINLLVKHVISKYKIPENKIILSGFSGGSRMASAYAVQNPGITGVIACGSGFSMGSAQIAHRIKNYIGIVGTEDMNLTEMITNHESALHQNLFHYLLIFPGGHSWPAGEYLKTALLLVDSSARRKDPRILNREKARVESFFKQGLILEAYFSCNSLQKFIRDQPGEGFEECENAEYEALARSSLESEKKQIYVLTNAFDLIRAESQGFKVEKKSPGWWKKELNKIHKILEHSTNASLILRNKRLLGFIQTNAYENAMILIGFEKKYEFATEFLKIWSLSDPENPLPHYSLARNYIRTGNTKLARKALKQSIQKGIEDIIDPAQDELLEEIYPPSK